MKAPKVSVIIPVYNVENYLRQCLDSVLNQSLQEIEIICVDDASTDKSLSIIEEYKNKDSRILSYSFENSQSALGARKLGVEMSTGEYIMFLDADDYLSPVACQSLYDKICEENVEILHFSSEIIDFGGNSESRLDMNRKMLTPYEHRLLNQDVFDYCFLKQLYGFTLWNKIYSSALCKYAFSKMENSFFPKAQDMYSFFIISFYAKSYLGWNSQPYYFYCFGRGVTGTQTVTLNTFKRYCMQSRVINALNNFCQNIENSHDNKYASIISRYQNQWLTECVNLWFNFDDNLNRAKSTEMLFQNWGSNTISVISQKYWYSRDIIAQKLVGSFSNLLEKKKVKTIALYYYHLTIGGVQRVISLLIPLFRKMGYHVILITDKAPSENDIILEEDIERITIFDYQKTNSKNYSLRIHDWEIILEKYSIDLLIYHAWTSPLLLWDSLFFKSNDVPVVVQTHSVFSYSLLSLGRDFACLPKIMAFCDGIVVLSEIDKLYWSHFNSHVYHIPNPISPSLRNIPLQSVRNQNLILWVGRFSNEKQPWESIYIMEKVVRAVPDALLYMIGDSQYSSVLEKYQKMIDQRHLTNNIKLLGYQQNLNQYFSQAKLTLITSTYEGFSMVLLESKAYGVPTVMYDLPYLDLAKSDLGSICVPANDRNSAAKMIVSLLTQTELWTDFHQQAHRCFAVYEKYDYQNSWESVLRGVPCSSCNSKESITMLNTILSHYMIGWSRNHQLQEKTNSITTKRFKGVRWFLQKFMAGVRCYQEHGLRYTLERIKQKFLAILRK